MSIAVVVLCATAVHAQHDEHDREHAAGAGDDAPVGARDGGDPTTVTAPIVGLLPLEALHELEAGAQAVRHFLEQRDRTHALPTPAQGGEAILEAYGRVARPRPRPPRCPRWLAAVLVDAESGIDPGWLFQRGARDLLVLRNPGPCVRSEEIALLERVVEYEALPLCVVLVQQGARALLRRRDPSPAQRALEDRTEAARRLATETGADLARAHAEIEGRRIFEASADLRRMRARGRFEVALGIVDSDGRLVEFVAPWRTDPIAALRARMALRQSLQEQYRMRAAAAREVSDRRAALEAHGESGGHGHAGGSSDGHAAGTDTPAPAGPSGDAHDH